jgi:outer membrane protein
MRTHLALTAALLSSLAVSVPAQTGVLPAAGDVSTTETPAKIAVIAFQAAVTQTNEFQRNFGDLQKKYEPKRDHLKSLNDEIGTLQKQLQREQEDDQNDFQQEMQNTFNGVAQKVGEVLVAYAQQHGYTLVLDGGEQQAQMVLYANPATDISKAILDAYNLKSGVPAPTQPAAATPKPATRPPAQHTPAQPQH